MGEIEEWREKSINKLTGKTIRTRQLAICRAGNNMRELSICRQDLKITRSGAEKIVDAIEKTIEDEFKKRGIYNEIEEAYKKMAKEEPDTFKKILKQLSEDSS